MVRPEPLPCATSILSSCLGVARGCWGAPLSNLWGVTPRPPCWQDCALLMSLTVPYNFRPSRREPKISGKIVGGKKAAMPIIAVQYIRVISTVTSAALIVFRMCRYFSVCHYRRFGGACYKHHVLHALASRCVKISRAIRTLT